MIEPIDTEWAKRYVDQLIASAQKVPAGAFRDAILLRADHVLDFIKAWKERTP